MMIKAAGIGYHEDPEKYDLKDVMWYYIKEHFEEFRTDFTEQKERVDRILEPADEEKREWIVNNMIKAVYQI